MSVVRGIVVKLVGVALMIAVAACQPASTHEAPASSRQALLTVAETPTRQQPGDVVWGRVPYCGCLADTATANVANALKGANLTVSLKEQSPRDGWLYFVATFDPHATKRDQISAAMVAGGAQVLPGPP